MTKDLQKRKGKQKQKLIFHGKGKINEAKEGQ